MSMIKNRKIIGIVGFIGAGKDSIADYLVKRYLFQRESFAMTLKDAVSSIFGWDRIKLEGKTEADRHWREQIDPWWSERLNIHNLTPRLILQQWGTEVCRYGFHDQIWIASLENKLRQTSSNIVISDCRFPNEIKSIKDSNGLIVRVIRGNEPSWYNLALSANNPSDPNSFLAKNELKNIGVHPSEWAWVGSDFDFVVYNNGTLEDLYRKIDIIV